MKPILVVIVGLCVCCAQAVCAGASSTDPIVIVFYEEGCPGCMDMEELLAGLLIGEPETAIVRHEITAEGSIEWLTRLCRAYGIEIPPTVPIVFVNAEVVVGMGLAQEFTLRKSIGDCLSLGCESPIARLPLSQLRADLPGLSMFLALFFALAWLQLR